MNNIILNINYLVDLKKVVKTKLAEDIGTSRTSFNNWLSEKNTMPITMLEPIAKALNIPISLLFMPHEVVKKTERRDLWKLGENTSLLDSEEKCKRCEELKNELNILRQKKEEYQEKYMELLEDIHLKNNQEVG